MTQAELDKTYKEPTENEGGLKRTLLAPARGARKEIIGATESMRKTVNEYMKKDPEGLKAEAEKQAKEDAEAYERRRQKEIRDAAILAREEREDAASLIQRKRAAKQNKRVRKEVSR